MTFFILLNDGVSKLLLNDGVSRALLNDPLPQQSDIIMRPYKGNWAEEPTQTSSEFFSS